MTNPTKTPKTATTTSTTNEDAMTKPAKTPKNAKTKTTTSTTKETAMTMHATTEATIPTPASTLAPATSAAPSTPSSNSPLSSKTGVALVFLQPPPANANIPAVPSGAASPNAANYRAMIPKATELAALPGAVADLKRFANFAQVFGVTGLPYAQVLQAFDVSNQWSTMREASSAWDAFAQTQEGISWGMLRAIMERMGPLFVIAAGGDPSLPVTFPSLATLLGAKKAIARKAVATRKLNDEAEAKGLPRTHGVAGKRRKKAADRAVVAAASSASGASAVAAPAAPAVTSASQPAGVGTNGATHT